MRQVDYDPDVVRELLGSQHVDPFQARSHAQMRRAQEATLEYEETTGHRPHAVRVDAAGYQDGFDARLAAQQRAAEEAERVDHEEARRESIARLEQREREAAKAQRARAEKLADLGLLGR